MSRWLRLSADRLIDGTEGAAIHDGAVLVENDRIVAVGPTPAVPDPAGAEHVTFTGCTLVPGLVDCHSHLNLPGDGTAIEEATAIGDELLVLQSAENARRALYSGVTTLRDNGARHTTTFSLRAATLESARAMGVDREVGSLEPGKLADLLVVEGDPTVDPLALEKVRGVFLGGTRIGGN